MKTLNELVEEYGANAFVLADEGNGSGTAEGGQACDYDEDAQRIYGAVEMQPLDTPHMSADGLECDYASDWIIVGQGDNPFRIRIFFWAETGLAPVCW